MKTWYSILILILTSFDITMAQNDLPYRKIPEPPNNYTAGSVAGRMVDGLGFRYFWATEGLRVQDLQFQPGEEARTSAQTIDHILGLSGMIRNTVIKQSASNKPSTFIEKRRQTLENLSEVSKVLKNSTDADLEKFGIVGSSYSLPFWNLINGPISDALWHVGQLVSFRRSSGNPFSSRVSVMKGKLRDWCSSN